MKKYYIIEFENENLIAVNEFNAIDTAINKCGLSIFGKYDIRLMPPVVVGNHVVLEVRIPENKVDGFIVGRQLRSISDYLVHNYDGKYTSKKGFRLLRYIEIPKPDFENNAHSKEGIDKFEIVARIVELLESKDPKDVDKITKINKLICD